MPSKALAHTTFVYVDCTPAEKIEQRHGGYGWRIQCDRCGKRLWWNAMGWRSHMRSAACRSGPIAVIKPTKKKGARMSKLSQWDLIDKILQHSPRVLFHGPPGTGKTYAGVRSGVQKDQRVYSITLHEDMAASQLKGHFIPHGGEFVWHDGPAIRAWREGARLVLNEIDHAGDDALTILYALLDDPEFAELTLETGEVVRPAEGFQVIATMNGDPKGLPFALNDRFPIKVEIVAPHPEAIKALDTDLQSMAKNLSVPGVEEERRASIRVLKAFSHLRTKINEEVAAQACFGKQAGEVVTALKISRAPAAPTS